MAAYAKKGVKKRYKRGMLAASKQRETSNSFIYIRDKDLLARSELCECFCDGLQNRQITHWLGYNMLVFSDVHRVRSNPGAHSVPTQEALRRPASPVLFESCSIARCTSASAVLM